jgi:hypothetical protein
MSRYGGSLNVDGAEGPYQAYMDAVITKDSIINQLNTLLTVATLLFGVIAAVFDSISVEEYKYVETLCAESLGDGGTIAEACEYIEVSSRVVGMLQLLALFFVSWTWIGEAMYSVCTLTTLHSLSYTLSHTLLSYTLSHTLFSHTVGLETWENVWSCWIAITEGGLTALSATVDPDLYNH